MKKSPNVSGKDIAKSIAFLSLFFGSLFILPILQISTTAKWIWIIILVSVIAIILPLSGTEKPKDKKEH